MSLIDFAKSPHYISMEKALINAILLSRDKLTASLGGKSSSIRSGSTQVLFAVTGIEWLCVVFTTLLINSLTNTEQISCLDFNKRYRQWHIIYLGLCEGYGIFNQDFVPVGGLFRARDSEVILWMARPLKKNNRADLKFRPAKTTYSYVDIAA